MINDDFSFLSSELQPSDKQGPVKCAAAVPVSVADVVADAAQRQLPQASLRPRTYLDWTRRLVELKAEKELAWQSWLQVRDRESWAMFRKWGSTASAEEIQKAKMDVTTLQRRIKVARARRSAWLWCPWKAVPYLNFHIVNPPPLRNEPLRLWTLDQKNRYYEAQIRELAEKLDRAVTVSKYKDRASMPKDPWPTPVLAKAEAELKRLKDELEAAEAGFKEFKLKGPPPETEEEEVARRLAATELLTRRAGAAGSASGTGASASGVGAGGGHGQGQSQRSPTMSDRSAR
jgi:hypothetical protein